MDSNVFDSRLRELEYFHTLRCLPDTWIVLRLDGRGFTKFTARAGFEKPFDLQFQDYMRITSQALLTELQGVYAFTESDEISILFNKDWDLYDREVEKLVSLSASIAGSAFSLASKQAAYFDSRIWLGVNEEQVLPLWQQHGTGFYWETYEKSGYNPMQQAETIALRRRIKINENLLTREEYAAFIYEQFLSKQTNEL